MHAIDAYRQAVNLAPRDARLRDALGGALKAAGRVAEAIAAFDESLRLEPKYEAAELDLADSYRLVFNYQAARKILVQSSEEHPRSVGPLFALGELEIQLQDYKSAIADLKRALALAPGDMPSRIDLGAAYKANGDIPQALETLDAVIRKEPHNALAHYLRASIYADQNDNARALADAKEVYRQQPENPRGRVLYAKVLLRVEKCAEAVNVLRPLADPKAADIESLYLLGRAYQCSGQAVLAKQTFAQFADSSQRDRNRSEDKTQSSHLVEQANTLARKNQFSPALDLLQQALAKDPLNGDAYSQLAKIYFSMGRIDEAENAVRRALEIHPYNPDFQYVQGRIFERKREWKEALEAFKTTVLVNPTEADAYYEMGRAYLKLDDHANAVRAFEKAVALSPDDPDYRRALTAASGGSDIP